MNYHQKILVMSAVYKSTRAFRYFVDTMMTILNGNSDVHWIVIDDHSENEIPELMKTLRHPRLETFYLEKNIGKGNAFNDFIKKNLSTENLPLVIFSIDADILFSLEDFNALANAVKGLPQLGFLSMRYRPNNCNPERNLWFPTRTFIGKDHQKYRIKSPTFCNVAGGVIALSGKTLADDLNFELYPFSEGKTYYPDDAFLYNKLKKKGKLLGYLEGTYAHHLRSGPNEDYPLYPPHYLPEHV